jgi:hypothetical protein
MDIQITWHGDNFNVGIASKENGEPFLEVKGCRIVDGSKGPFVSYPAKKNEATGKWWNHVYGSEKFNAVVLSKAQESMPRQQPRGRSGGQASDPDGDIPFSDPLRGKQSLVQ